MRFITEFESTYEATFEPGHEKYINAYKGRGELEIGSLIGASFGWKEDQQRFKIRNTLEIEAFPMDKWIEFKNRLMEHLNYCEEHNELPDTLAVLRFIKELEFFNSNETKKPG